MTTMMTIDTTNMSSHLQKKLFLQGGEYYPIWKAIQEDKEITAVVHRGSIDDGSFREPESTECLHG